MIRRVHVTVEGRVQGVGYRYATRAEAVRRGIDGWVRNRADGTVEAELQGADDAVSAMVTWMSSGPPSARVTRIETTAAAATAEHGFQMLPTQ